MRRESLPVLSLVLSMIALGVAFAGLVAGGRPAGASEVAGPAAEASARIAALEGELAAIADELAAVRRERGGSLRAPEEREAVEAAGVAEADVTHGAGREPEPERVRELLDRLEQVELGLEEVTRAGPDVRFVASEPEPTTDEDVWNLRGRAADPTLTEAERLAALRELRFAGPSDGSDGRSPEVVAAMVDLYGLSADAETRADIFRQLDEVTDPVLLPALMHAVQNDGSSEVREEAAETLAPYLPDPNVEATLRWLLENDPSRDVREQAAESLAALEKG